jgi:prepilin-type N-terminal cleavage/methylation domain-containing protein
MPARCRVQTNGSSIMHISHATSAARGPRAASFPLHRRHVRQRGFTLVELVAVMIIMGSLAIMALQVFRDLRYDATRATMDGIRTAIAANAQQARTAWLVQGGGSTVTMQGRTIAVHPTEVTVGGWKLPPGSPTAPGMYAMLNCGPTPWTPTYTPSRCQTMPGWFVGGTGEYLAFWPERASATWSGTWCGVAYWPSYGYDPATPVTPHATDPHFNMYMYAEQWTRPATTQVGGC